MVMFGLGFLVALLGYLTGSRTLRLTGIVLLFAATGVLLADVFTISASGAARVSSISHLAGALALAGVEGGES
jgi:hypothetical protein